MPAWLPLIKASIPYVAQIVTTAIPAFTSKPPESKTDPVVAKQIEELQTAVTKNAESIHVLAEKLQQTIEGIDGAASTLQNNLERDLAKMRSYLIASCTFSGVALLLALWALLR